MLSSLTIRNLAVIEEVALDFGPGFTVLTGETGAGKSILIDALALLIGGRADARLVRDGCDKAEVAAAFDLGDAPAARDWLRAQDYDSEDECLLRRILQADGRTRAFINGRAASAAELRELGECLLEIFGQGESQSLMRTDTQRAILDDFGAYPDLLSAVAAAAAEYAAVAQRIEALSKASQRDPAQIDYLRFQLQELEALGLREGEIEILDSEHRRLSGAGRLIEEGGAAQQRLYGGEASVYDQLAEVGASLRGLQPIDAEFGEVENQVGGLLDQVREAHDALRRLLERLDLDPERLEEIDARIAAIHALARKHRVRAEDLPARTAELRGELDATEGVSEQLALLQKDLDESRQRYAQAAQALGQARAAAAAALAGTVCAHIHELGMPNAELVIAVEAAGRTTPHPLGEDHVRFDFSANPGQAPRALAKVASGGELSRISLAIRVSLRGVGHAAPTMIFDEVDAGIGGAVGETVGRRLRALGEQRQVFCITHLPQVAARGERHWSVRKEIEAGRTYTRVVEIAKDERLREIARMLGGETLTPASAALAKDLLRA